MTRPDCDAIGRPIWWLWAVFAVFVCIACGPAPQAHRNPRWDRPTCIESHSETVKAHDDIYVYDLHTPFVGPQVSITHVPEHEINVCDRWTH